MYRNLMTQEEVVAYTSKLLQLGCVALPIQSYQPKDRILNKNLGILLCPSHTEQIDFSPLRTKYEIFWPKQDWNISFNYPAQPIAKLEVAFLNDNNHFGGLQATIKEIKENTFSVTRFVGSMTLSAAHKQIRLSFWWNSK